MTNDPQGRAAVLPPLRIFIDLTGHGEWYRRELETLIEGIAQGRTAEAVLVDGVNAADCVLRIEGCPQLRDSISTCFRWRERKSPREFIWETGDLPTGVLPGFYVSLPAYMFDRRRHRAFCLPIRCVETIRAYDLSDATFLYGFFGALSSGLRGRIARALQAQNDQREGLIEIRDSIWGQMFDRSGLKAKADYADNLRRCRFNLCPRGNVLAGAGSRLYETMQAARVPVIISDWMTLPEDVDWNSCSVRVRERDIARIPEILREYSDRWPQMAVNARRAWETHFCEEALLGGVGTADAGDAGLGGRRWSRREIERPGPDLARADELESAPRLHLGEQIADAPAGGRGQRVKAAVGSKNRAAGFRPQLRGRGPKGAGVATEIHTLMFAGAGRETEKRIRAQVVESGEQAGAEGRGA